MRIVFTASEAMPFSKTGGLADVAGALPVALAALGHDVVLVVPHYSKFSDSPELNGEVQSFELSIQKKSFRYQLLPTSLGDSTVQVYLVDQPELFGRLGIYGEGGGEYPDNSARFIFFCRAVLALASRLPGAVDILHSNDWHTGLASTYLKTSFRDAANLADTRALFSIHNLAYQGRFWHWDMLLTGLDWKLFNWRQLEFFGSLNLMKAGIVFGDAISTVSPRYAYEIQTEEFGCGLDSVLRDRSDRLHGIVNGIDYSDWSPDIDRRIGFPYDAESFLTEKPKCKAAIQAEMCLPVNSTVPLISMVSRLDQQKGLDLLEHSIESIVAMGPQLLFLGTGLPKYHRLLERLKARFPTQIAVKLMFDEAMAHRIQAGSDMLLVPSQYEPCGLTQMVGLRYGTIPIVRRTGGLADTIVHTTPESMGNRTANGFSFGPYTRNALLDCIDSCLTFWRHPSSWQRLVKQAMLQDWSWGRSAGEYERLYEQMRQRPRVDIDA